MQSETSKGRLLTATIAAALLAFGAHVVISEQTGPLIGVWMQGHTVLRPPYPPGITLLAALTAILPALGALLMGLAVYDHLPGRAPWSRGLTLGVLILFVKGELLRAPIMSIAVGNPWYVALVQQGDKWVANLALGMVIVLGINWARRGRSSPVDSTR